MNILDINKNILKKQEETQTTLENNVDKYIDYLFKKNAITYGEHFYLKEILITYINLKNEKKNIIENNINNDNKLKVLNNLIFDCEQILDDYEIIKNVKESMHSNKTKVLAKYKPIIAYNIIK